MLRNLIDLLKGTREWFVHSGWLLADVALWSAELWFCAEERGARLREIARWSGATIDDEE